MAFAQGLTTLSGVWLGTELGSEEQAVFGTGHALLDFQLPDNGWPQGLVELLSDLPAPHAWQLLLPALASVTNEQAGPVILVGAPFEPFCPALHAQGLPADRLLRITAEKHQAQLWAAEQSLRCADVPAVLAWLPQCKSTDLRRMQLAAHQHQKLLFVFRPLAALNESSPARLRLVLEGTDELVIRIAKRRGPPLVHPILLPSQPPRLAALLASRKGRALPVVQPSLPTPKDRSLVLDRTEALA